MDTVYFPDTLVTSHHTVLYYTLENRNMCCTFLWAGGQSNFKHRDDFDLNIAVLSSFESLVLYNKAVQTRRQQSSF